MQYWLVKSEPSVFGIDDLARCKHQTEPWDGVRNYQVRNMIRDDMQVGDLAFFYHSNKGLEVVGICEVSAESAPDSTTDDERWDCVHLRALCDMPDTTEWKYAFSRMRMRFATNTFWVER